MHNHSASTKIGFMERRIGGKLEKAEYWSTSSDKHCKIKTMNNRISAMSEAGKASGHFDNRTNNQSPLLTCTSEYNTPAQRPHRHRSVTECF